MLSLANCMALLHLTMPPGFRTPLRTEMVSKAPPPQNYSNQGSKHLSFFNFFEPSCLLLKLIFKFNCCTNIKCSMIYITCLTWSKLHLATLFLTIRTELKPNHRIYNSESNRTRQTYIISYGPIPELFDSDTT